MSETNEEQRAVKRLDSNELIDKLAVMLGFAGDESTEIRHSDELFKRRVLREAIKQLDMAWNPSNE